MRCVNSISRERQSKKSLVRPKRSLKTMDGGKGEGEGGLGLREQSHIMGLPRHSNVMLNRELMLTVSPSH